jgi:hypothetical protein
MSPLQGRADGGDQHRRRGGRQRLDTDDVAGHDQPDELGGDQVGAEPGVRGAELAGDRAEDLLGHELAQHGGGAFVGDRRADHGQHRAALVRPVPHRQEQPEEPLAEHLPVLLVHQRDERLERVDGELDGGDEQVLLPAEEVVDQCRVDAGHRRHLADAGLLVAALGEGAPGRVEDRLAGAAVAGTPAGPRHRSPSSLELASC